MRRLWKPALLILVCLFFWQRCSPISHAPGVLIIKEPEQVLFSSVQPLIEKQGWKLKPLALYSIEARVLGTRGYSDDPSADLSPYDLALGWGRMSDTAVLEKLDISQSNRFFHWRYYTDQPPIPRAEIICHAANTHLIPEDDRMREKIAGLRVGALVKMSGYLVEATNPKSAVPWRSSLTRDDEGDGACEIFYVRTLSELK